MNPTVDVSDSKRALLDQKLCVDKLSCSVCKSKFRVTFRNRQASAFLGVGQFPLPLGEGWGEGLPSPYF